MRHLTNAYFGALLGGSLNILGINYTMISFWVAMILIGVPHAIFVNVIAESK